jgi:DNA gyrase subunit B
MRGKPSFLRKEGCMTNDRNQLTEKEFSDMVAASTHVDAKYDENQIQVLEGLEAVRHRPGMYIGSTGVNGLEHLIYEIVDNSIDEALAGFCNNIEVRLNKDGSVTIKDDGRGFPVGNHAKLHRPAVEVCLTVLHAGGKFGGDGYKVSGGLHGVGAAVVNALSKKLIVTVYKEGKIYQQKFKRGKIMHDLEEIGITHRTGTTVQFWPDIKSPDNPEGIFDEGISFRLETLRSRLREMAFLNKGVKIFLGDYRLDEPFEKSYCFNGGIKEFVSYINRNKKVLFEDPIYLEGIKNEIVVEVAMQYNDSFTENTYSFANNVKTPEGGSHLSGFYSALTRTINDYARRFKILKDADPNLKGEDVRESLTAIISVKLHEPQFEGQTKTKLGNSEVRGVVDSIVSEGLSAFLEENPSESRAILDRALAAARAREAAKKARDLTRRKTVLESASLPGKLADCSEKDPSKCEIFIVEGESAGGSAKKGRDRHYQAILPLRGKILNVEKTRMDRALSNNEIKNMITAFGCGIGDDFDINKLRYHRIVCMTDADVDGAHIRILLLTFFYRYMRPLIDNGYVYIAMPPLYKVTKGKKERYVYDDMELQNLLDEIGRDPMPELQRYKGLGEMSAEQLWHTTMNPESRTMMRVTSEDAVAADETLNLLMGDQVEPRREFIQDNYNMVTDLDL